MLILEILCGWFALSGVAAIFVYCCSRVSESDRRSAGTPAGSEDEVLAADTDTCGAEPVPSPVAVNR